MHIFRIKNSNKFYSKHYWFLRLSIQIHTQISSQLSRGFSLVKTNEKLKGYFESGHVDGARKLFDKMPKRDEFTYNSMVAGFANAGRFNEAKQVFDETPKRSSITWSALISGYCKYGYEDESFDLFWRMRYEGERPSQYTLGSLLRLCSVKGFLSRGEKLHGFIIKTGFGNNAFVVTGLVDMYVKCYRIKAAEKLFRTMDSGKNHVTWTAIINGYSLNGNSDKTLQCFCQMRSEGIEANQYTFPSVLTACGSASDLRFGEQVHGCVVRGGFHANIFVQSALVDMYAKCGDLNCAKEVLESMEVLQVVAWNSMIVGYMRHGLEENALSLLEKMHGIGLKMDEFTYPSVLNALALRKDAFYGECLHCFIIKTGFCDHILVSNALVDMYAKQGSSIGALEVFNEIKDKDVISWTSMITGCTHNGSHEEALNFFQRMRIAGIYPDQVSVSSTLSSCAELTLHELGKQVHGNYIKSGPETSLSVDNSLLAMYAKCGCLDDAITVFYSMTSRNVMSWTAIIVGHAQNGRGKEALPFYDEMVLTGIKPDFITFIGLLFACSHAGLVDEGRQYFGTMIDAYGIQPGPDHYASMIDLLARSGKLQEAESLVNEMVDKPGPAVWKALLTACRKHGNMDIAKRAAMTLIELDPQDAFPYVILSNMYSAAGRWEDAAGLRRLMKLRGVIKEPGCSWIEINSKVHTFFSEDRSHPNTNEIYLKVNDIIRLIKEAGYVPDVKFSLHDVNEETKELGLAYHGEKLAIAFGLLYLPENAPIRIFKNLRVCGDCHNAMKIISKVFHRYIVLRDSNCFHHFKEGQCSCGDYW
ncbi:hypothetical protein LIER_20914 [Lithospermum erythrorhizon]|uniref:DYW domain-containing protein n=1 Tax=Lithospermum erythrorhizon TaxID=34254 RepID=A0AAV3QPC1_LITER